MPNTIKVSKGLSIKLVGESEKQISGRIHSKIYGIYPSDFHGITPKMIIKQGDEVKAGEPIFHSKSNEKLMFVSPVSGEIAEIVRGAKRKILEIKILADKEISYYTESPSLNIDNSSREEIIDSLLGSGLWSYIKQRPYDVIANPEVTPKAIFISGFHTTPLAPDTDFTLNDKAKEIHTAVSLLTKLTDGKVHITLPKGNFENSLKGIKNVEYHEVNGNIHPAGNVGTQINKIDPINKGETIWVVNPEDLVVIGNYVLTGRFVPERTVALSGSSFENPKYITALAGVQIKDVLTSHPLKPGDNRIISGDVLTGSASDEESFLRHYSNQITSISEGKHHRFFGWLLPDFSRLSITRAMMFSFLTPNKKFDLDTNTNGEERALVVTGHYDKVFPLDILPNQLIKAILIKDLEEMENLGIYEVAPEDFALPEFICPSKLNIQSIVREGLDLLQKEVG